MWCITSVIMPHGNLGETNRRCLRVRCHKLEAHAQNYRNRMLQFSKSECPVLSGPTTERGTVGFDESILPLAKWCVTRGGIRTTVNPKDCVCQITHLVFAASPFGLNLLCICSLMLLSPFPHVFLVSGHYLESIKTGLPNFSRFVKFDHQHWCDFSFPGVRVQYRQKNVRITTYPNSFSQRFWACILHRFRLDYLSSKQELGKKPESNLVRKNKATWND
jgi:hypothetical protein